MDLVNVNDHTLHAVLRNLWSVIPRISENKILLVLAAGSFFGAKSFGSEFVRVNVATSLSKIIQEYHKSPTDWMANKLCLVKCTSWS